MFKTKANCGLSIYILLKCKLIFSLIKLNVLIKYLPSVLVWRIVVVFVTLL